MYAGVEPNCVRYNGVKTDIKSPSTALKSLENHLDLVGRPLLAMDETNNNINCVPLSTKIRTEVFTDHYEVEEEIGRGKFAVVKRCKHRTKGNLYAAKFLRKRRKGKDARQEVLHEIAMLEMALIHPRLVDLVEVFETKHELILITEYASGGELYQQVILEERLEEKYVIRLMRQVIEALIFLHDRNIVHLDVKPQNVLLTKNYRHGDIKLCDFGFARKVNSGDDIRDIIGTPDYVAPEVLSYEPIRTACDMWSCGVLAYVMLSGYSPFAGETKQETFLNVSQVNLEFPDDLFEDVSQDAQDFISQLLVKEPSQRMIAHDCLNHKWLRCTDNDSLRIPRSPFGSPIGHRRALTPATSPEGSFDAEPVKKCKCDEDKCVQDCQNGIVIDEISPEDSMVNGFIENNGTPEESEYEDCTASHESDITTVNVSVHLEEATERHLLEDKENTPFVDSEVVTVSAQVVA